MDTHLISFIYKWSGAIDRNSRSQRVHNFSPHGTSAATFARGLLSFHGFFETELEKT